MSCNKCENCNGCQDQSCSCSKIPCGCKDVALSGPCGYTLCTTGAERCDDIQCAECVSYCGTSFQIETAQGIVKFEAGERLDQIIQKLAVFSALGVGNCTAENVHHAPYNVYAEGIEKNKATVVWGGISSLSEGFKVYYDTVVSPTGWTQANTNLISVSETTFEILELAPATEYKIKVTSIFGGAYCDSVEILIATLEE